MNKQQLVETLRSLHEQLQQQPAEIDEETLIALRTIAADVTTLIDGDPAITETSSHRELADRIRDTVEQFEGEHPQLTMVLTQIAEFLARIGI